MEHSKTFRHVVVSEFRLGGWDVRNKITMTAYGPDALKAMGIDDFGCSIALRDRHDAERLAQEIDDYFGAQDQERNPGTRKQRRA